MLYHSRECTPELHSILSLLVHKFNRTALASGIQCLSSSHGYQRCIKMRSLIVKISIICHCYQLMLTQCQFHFFFRLLTTFSAPNRPTIHPANFNSRQSTDERANKMHRRVDPTREERRACNKNEIPSKLQSQDRARE